MCWGNATESKEDAFSPGAMEDAQLSAAAGAKVGRAGRQGGERRNEGAGSNPAVWEMLERLENPVSTGRA